MELVSTLWKHFYWIYFYWKKTSFHTHTNQDSGANSELKTKRHFTAKKMGGLLTNQPAVALTASNKEIAELILLFINNAWLRTDNL